MAFVVVDPNLLIGTGTIGAFEWGCEGGILASNVAKKLVTSWSQTIPRLCEKLVLHKVAAIAAVKEKRPIVIQRNFAAWIALYRI